MSLVRLLGTELLGIRDYFGTEAANDEPSLAFSERVGRCYELASYAVAFGSAPAGSLVVHGSWEGPGATQRIGHAWVLLPRAQGSESTTFAWEPITAAVYPYSEFTQITKAWEEARYDLPTLHRLLLRTEHYGRWHASRYP